MAFSEVLRLPLSLARGVPLPDREDLYMLYPAAISRGCLDTAERDYPHIECHAGFAQSGYDHLFTHSLHQYLQRHGEADLFL